MASILKNIGRSTNVPYKTFEADTVEDMQAIDVSHVIMGSRCYIIDTGEWYALNSQKQWKAVPSGGGGGGIDPDTTYIYDGGNISGSDDVTVIYDGGTLS